VTLTLQLRRKDIIMLWTIAVILIILWLLGLITSYTLGGFIHILLVLAIIVILYNVISGRKGST
jgi:asparagine N-glycosylation enzyme membrane subunit Stt3